MFGEGFPSFLGDRESRVRASSDKLFPALDVPEFLEAAGVAGKVAVREIEQVLEGDEIHRLVDDQHGHDAKPSFAFKSLVDIFEYFFHAFTRVFDENNAWRRSTL